MYLSPTADEAEEWKLIEQEKERERECAKNDRKKIFKDLYNHSKQKLMTSLYNLVASCKFLTEIVKLYYRKKNEYRDFFLTIFTD